MRLNNSWLQDPFNLLAIYGLGKAYAADEQWDRCCNVQSLVEQWKKGPWWLCREYRRLRFTQLWWDYNKPLLKDPYSTTSVLASSTPA